MQNIEVTDGFDVCNANISTSEDAFSNPAVACVLLHCQSC